MAGLGPLAKSSISAARAKVGFAPLVTLHECPCLPLSHRVDHPHAFYGGLRRVAIDGSNVEVPDETENAREFGYPGSRCCRRSIQPLTRTAAQA